MLLVAPSLNSGEKVSLKRFTASVEIDFVKRNNKNVKVIFTFVSGLN